MKKQLTLKYLLMLPVLLALACKQTPGEKIGAQSNSATAIEKKKEDKQPDPAIEKKETAANKQTTGAEAKGSTAKKGVAKWEANGAASKIGFSVKGPFGTVNGNLSGLQSTIVFDKNNLPASSIEASTKAGSISTGIKLRNKDLQKEKYLDAGKYPEISFKSNKIEKSGNGYKAIGELTIKGVSKHEEIPFSFSETGDKGVFKGNFTIQRKDFGVGDSGGSIGNDINVDLTVPVTKVRS